MSTLTIEDINTYYGNLHVLRDVSLEIEEEDLVALLGRNGAGKTTIYRSILGLTPPRSGTVHLNGQEITGMKPHNVSRAGVGFVPSDRGMFGDLTVRDTLEIFQADGTPWNYDRLMELFPELEPIRNHKCRNLSGGQQRMVSIARALSTDPDVILMDEPVEGLAPQIIDDVGEMITDIRKTGIAIMLAEHNMDFVMEYAEQAYILERGEVKWTGSIDRLEESGDVIERYLSV